MNSIVFSICILKIIAMNWISVNERLPEEGKEVLTYHGSNHELAEYRLSPNLINNCEMVNRWAWSISLLYHG
uniref:DUF551 domain-containing protein n=1 Tax=Parapedobacter tibetensis TaxID=2972951 RepID=UPI00356B7183